MFHKNDPFNDFQRIFPCITLFCAMKLSSFLECNREATTSLTKFLGFYILEISFSIVHKRAGS